MTFFLWAAALVAIVTFLVHTFVGGRVVVRPLLASTSLPIASKMLNYYCWHITTLFIAFAAVAFGWIAYDGMNVEFCVFLSASTAAFSLLSAGVAVKGGFNPLQFPSTSLFAVTSALGWSAVLAPAS